MTDIIDAPGSRVVGYLVVAALAAGAGIADRRRVVRRDDPWPAFWWLTALVLATMGASRGLHVNEFVADAGRFEARSTGFYEQRRGAQAVVVVSMAGVWGLLAIVAIRRQFQRRRRYLPTAVLTGGLFLFASIRLISLHQIDELLYHRSIAGIRPVAWVEWAGLVATGIAISSFTLTTPS